jgi:cytoskeletal protein CcmA (bactofilin family)
MSKWFDLSENANKIRQSYFKGFIDISGGGIYLRNDLSINFYDNTNSANPKFSIKSDSMRIQDASGQYYDISNDKLLFIKDLSVNVQSKLDDLTGRTLNITSNGNNTNKMMEFDNSNNQIILYSNIVPNVADILNLGTPDKPFSSLYVNEGTIHFINKQTKLQTASITYDSETGSLDLSTNTIKTSLNNTKVQNGILVTPLLTYGGNVGIGKTDPKSALDISGAITISGGASISGLLTHTGDISLNGNLYIKKDVALDGNVSVTSGSLITTTPELTDSSIRVATTEFVKSQNYAPIDTPTFSGTSTIQTGKVNQKFSVEGDVSLNSKLYVFHKSSFNNTMYVDGDVSLNSKLAVNDDVSLNKNVNIGGNLTVQTQSDNDNSRRVATTEFVKNQRYAQISGANFTGDVSMNTKLSVIGDVSLNSKVYISGDTSMNGNVNVRGNLTSITQPSTDNSTKVATTEFVKNQAYSKLASPTFSGIVTIPTANISSLSVTGETTINGNINVTTQDVNDNSTRVATTEYVKNQGYAKIESPTFTGTATMANSIISQKLEVQGDVSMNKNINVAGNIITNGSMNVAGSIITTTQSSSDNSTKVATTAFVKNQGYALLSGAEFTGDVKTKQNLYVENDTSLNGNLIVNGITVFNSDVRAITQAPTDNSNKVATTEFVAQYGFAKIDSPQFTGIPLAPTPPMGTLNKQIATTEFVRTEIVSFINTLPDAFDAIQQLSQAFSNSDAQLATSVASSLGTKADKESPTFTGTVTLPITNINNTLTVYGETIIDDNVKITGDLSVNGLIYTPTAVSSDNSTRAATTAFVKNQGYAKLSGANFTGDVYITTNLQVTNDVSLNSKLNVGSDIITNGNLISNSDATINKNLSVLGDSNLNGNLSVAGILSTSTPNTSDNTTKVATTEFVKNQGYAQLSGAIFTGDVSLNSKLQVTKDVSMNKNVDINGNVFINNKLFINGDASFNNKLSIGGDVISVGNLFINKNIYENGVSLINKYATLESPTFTGNVGGITKSMVGLENVDNTNDLDKPVSTATQNVLNIKANLISPSFSGNATLQNVSVNGKMILLSDLSLNGNLVTNRTIQSQTPNLNDNSNLVATTSFVKNQGFAKLTGADFTGDVTTTGNLSVSGNVSMNKILSVGGDLNVGGSITALTQQSNDSSNKVATTEFVKNQGYVTTYSPEFTGIPTAPTSSTSVPPTDQIATTLYVENKITDFFNVASTATINSINQLSQAFANSSSSLEATIANQLAYKADLASPIFNGNVTLPLTTVTDKLILNNDASFNGKLTLGRDAIINGNLNVLGKSVIGGDLSLNSKLFIANDTKINRNLFVQGDLSMVGTLNVSSFIYERGELLSTRYASLDSPNFTGTATFDKAIINVDFVVNADAKLNSKLNVTGDVSLNSSLKVGQSIYENGVSLINKYATLESPTFTGNVAGISKSMVGLSNVDNTSDLDKPLSTATTTAINLKANIASPQFTGVPTAPTANVGTNTTQIATTEYVQTEISGITGSPPSNLNTLNKIAIAINNDASFSNTISTNINLKSNISSPTFTGTVTLPDTNVIGNLSFSKNLTLNSDLNVGGNIYANYAPHSIPSTAIQFISNEYAAMEINTMRNDYVTFDDEGFETSMSAGTNGVIETLYSTTTDLSLNGNLYINGTGLSVINTDLSLNGNLSLGKDLYLNTKLITNKDVSMNGNLYVNNKAIINDDVSMNKNLDLSGSLIAHNNVNVYGIINQYTVSLDQGYIVNYADKEATIQSLQQQITTLQQQLASVLQILSNNNIQ